MLLESVSINHIQVENTQSEHMNYKICLVLSVDRTQHSEFDTMKLSFTQKNY